MVPTYLGANIMAMKRLLFLKEEGGIPFIGDVIEYQNKLWLVSGWIAGPTAGIECPERIVCLDGLRLDKALPEHNADLVLTTPLSRDILEGRRVSHNPLVIERPEIHLRVDTDFHR
jgi:hypothetical protein